MLIGANKNILLEEELGVIESVGPRPVKLDAETEYLAFICATTTCFITPEGRALLGKAVALDKLIAAGVPVALVNTKADGVPKLGVVKTGLVSVSGAFKPAWFTVLIGII